LGQAHPRKSAFAPPTLSAARFHLYLCELLIPNFEVCSRPLNFYFRGTRLLLAQHRPNRALPGSCPWRTRPRLCRRRFSWRVRPGRCLLVPYLVAAKPPTASAFESRRTSPRLFPSRAPPELQVRRRPSSIPPAVESHRRNRRHQQLCEVELDLRRPRLSTGKHRSTAHAWRPAAFNAPLPAAPTEIRPPPLIFAPVSTYLSSPPSTLSIPHLIADPSSPEPWHRRPSGPPPPPVAPWSPVLRKKKVSFLAKAPTRSYTD
jgi:hypothetical protein